MGEKRTRKEGSRGEENGRKTGKANTVNSDKGARRKTESLLSYHNITIVMSDDNETYIKRIS